MDEPVDTIQAAEEQGTVHFWVEVPQKPQTNPDERLICEIAAEPDGGVKITETLPSHYHYIPGGRIEHDPEIITINQLRGIEGYENLSDNGLIVD